MALTPYSGNKPQRNVRATFSTYMDAWITWFLDTFMTEIDAVVTAFNLNDLNATSATSNSLGTGSKTFVTQSSKSYVDGMQLLVADDADPSNKWMQGRVTSYSGTSLTIDVHTKSGAGTLSDWIISFDLPVTSVGNQEVTVHTGNGFGSTNTKIRRFSTTLINVGTDITYADSSTLGASFTINTPGKYEIYTSDLYSSAGAVAGASLNSSQLTSNLTSIAIADVVCMATCSTANKPGTATRTMNLTSTDIIRPHVLTSGTASTADDVLFSIRRIG